MAKKPLRRAQQPMKGTKIHRIEQGAKPPPLSAEYKWLRDPLPPLTFPHNLRQVSTESALVLSAVLQHGLIDPTTAAKKTNEYVSALELECRSRNEFRRRHAYAEHIRACEDEIEKLELPPGALEAAKEIADVSPTMRAKLGRLEMLTKAIEYSRIRIVNPPAASESPWPAP